MAWQCLHSILKDASAGEVYEKTYTEVYLLDSIADFNPFLFACKKKNTLVVEPNGANSYVYFIVDSNNITKRQSMPGGKIQLELTIKLRWFRNMDELMAPWDLPAYNFRISQGTNEESASVFYPGDDDLWLSEDADPHEFVNSAGCMLEGNATYATSQISFSYGISVLTFLKIQDWFWSLAGKINCDPVVICGMKFPKRTLRLDSLNAEYCETQKPGIATTGVQQVGTTVYYDQTVVDTLYKYYRVDASFTANPKTWNQYFLNVGTHVRRNGVVARLWSWNNPTTNAPMWGTYQDYRAAGGINGEALTEPVALNPSGTNASGIIDDNGRLKMTYRHGALYEPISFQALGFPSALPMKWSYD